MKRMIVSLITVALLLSMTACGGLGRPEIEILNFYEVEHFFSSFEDQLTPQEILDELRGVDLTGKKINYNGMESETITDEESSTSITYYSKDGERIYAVYEGYGEECVDFYTETKSGYKATVKYIYPGTEETFVDITFVKDEISYFINYETLNQKFNFGAENISIFTEKSREPYAEYLEYHISYPTEEIYCVIWSARYVDEQGRYVKFMRDEGDSILVENFDVEKHTLNGGLSPVFLQSSENAEILVGPHTVYTDEAGDFYIESTLTFIGEDEKSIDTLVKEYDFTKGKDINDEFDIAYNDVVLKFADDCKVDGYENVFDFVMDEYNDYVYKSVSFNEDGEISKVSSGTLSYY